MTFIVQRRVGPKLKFDTCGTYETQEEAKAAQARAIEVMKANGYEEAEAIVVEKS